MEIYTSWNVVPDHLKTKTQMAKAGLKLSPGQKPIAVKSGGYGPYDLYDIRLAVPKRPLTEAQKEATVTNLEKVRAAQHCVDCGVYGYRDLDSNGRCRYCRQRHHIDTASGHAQERLVELAVSGDWVIVDTETTGLDETAEVVQIGIVDAAGNVLMNQLVKPSGRIDPGATAVTGIDATTVAHAPTWIEIYPDVARLLNGCHILAYNAAFDQRIVSQTCRQHGTPVPASSWECIMELTAACIGDWSSYHDSFRWHKLTAVYSLLDIRPFLHELPPAHNAAGDAWLTWKVVQSFSQSRPR